MHTASGFTLTELLIVITVIAIVASIAIPNLRSSRLGANESAAVATLKSIASAQAQCRASGFIDANSNGVGEYGFFGELSGVSKLRRDQVGGVRAEVLDPPLLAGAFRRINQRSVIRSGYVFGLWLASPSGVPVRENATGGSSGLAIGAARAEIYWIAYAWPKSYDNSGNRVFFVNQTGDVLSSRNKATKYSGTDFTFPWDAAFAGGVATVTMGSSIAANSTAAAPRSKKCSSIFL